MIRVQPIHNELGSAGVPGDPTYSRKVAVESLLLTVDHLEIERAHFAGWSSGGKGLLDFAIAYPSRLISMTLVEPAAADWILEAVGESDREHQEATDFLHSLAGQEVSDDDLARFLFVAGFLLSDRLRLGQIPIGNGRGPIGWPFPGCRRSLMGSDHSVADRGRGELPGAADQGKRTGTVERRVVDLLALHLPNARVVELEAAMPTTSRASTGSWRNSKHICTEGNRQQCRV